MSDHRTIPPPPLPPGKSDSSDKHRIDHDRIRAELADLRTDTGKHARRIETLETEVDELEAQDQRFLVMAEESIAQRKRHEEGLRMNNETLSVLLAEQKTNNELKRQHIVGTTALHSDIVAAGQEIVRAIRSPRFAALITLGALLGGLLAGLALAFANR